MKIASYISGASGFVGLMITEHLASQGKDLLLSARNENRLQEIVQNLAKRYPGQH
jgi:short subunit dehydrogenase-like uncharacterized protein